MPVYWTSGSSTDWASTGNWSGSAIPTNTDDIVFDGDYGTADVLLNLDRDAALDGTWGTGTKITIRDNFPGVIGSSGSPLIMNFTGTLRHYGAGEEFYFKNANATGVLKTIVASKGMGAGACVLDGEYIDITQMAGRITLAAAMSFTSGGRIRIAHDARFGASPVLATGTGATVAGTTMVVAAGKVTCGVAMPVIFQRGGLVEHTQATVPVVYQSGGIYRPKAGTVTAHHIFGKEAQFDGASYSDWTITAMYAGDGAKIDLRNAIGTVPTALDNSGAEIMYGSGAI